LYYVETLGLVNQIGGFFLFLWKKWYILNICINVLGISLVSQLLSC
jgi:hypothetical protein